MKRSNNFFVYICGIVFCSLFMLFVNGESIKAAEELTFTYTCMDKESNNACSLDTTEGYYVLEDLKIIYESVEDVTSINEITIPDSYTGEYGTFLIEKISSNAISFEKKDDVVNTDTTLSLSLDTLTLPSGLTEIASNGLTSINSLTNLRIPTSMKTIGSTIFSDGANVENVYLDHYRPSVTITDDPISIAADSFTNASVTRFICANFSIHKWYTDNMASDTYLIPRLTVVVTYNYYQYESVDKSDIYATRQYYIGSTISDIPSISDDVNNSYAINNINGLNFLGWYLKHEGKYIQLSNGLNNMPSGVNVAYNSSATIYSVYPKYELKEITYDLNRINHSNIASIEATYNGSANLIELVIENISHEIGVDNTDFNYSVEWYKDSSTDSITSLKDVLSSQLSKVADSGNYKTVMTYSYLYEGTTYTKSKDQTIEVTINPAYLYVIVDDATTTYGTYLNNTNVTYIIQGLVGNDKIDVINNPSLVSLSYPNSGNINVGTYTNAIKVEVRSILNGTEERIENYIPIYSYGTYTVTHKHLTVYIDEDVQFTYGDTISIIKVYQDKAYNQYDNDIAVYFAKASGSDVGTYTINGVKNISDSNYIADFDSTLTTGKVIINPKLVATEVEVDYMIYDGNAKDVKVYYTDINGARVEIPYTITSNNNVVNEVINAGTYMVMIDSLGDDNYGFIDPNYQVLMFDILKATPKVTYSAYQSFTYSGSKINPLITINNNEQTPIFTCMVGSIQGDYCVNAGVYNVSVKYSESANYSEYNVGAITVSISKYVINLSPKEFNFYYGEEVDAKEELVINGEKVIAQYYTSANKTSELGSYDISSVVIKDENGDADHGNYMGSIYVSLCEDKINIIKRPITIMYYNYEGLVYNGREKVIGAYALDNITNKVVEGLEFDVVCDEGVIKDAKTYHLRAYFDDIHYVATNSNLLTFNVAKATIDLSHITLNDSKFTLDFKEHAIEVNGTLPEGVSVVYTIDGEEGNSTSSAFSHTVVASFVFDSQNYMPVEDIQATIYIDMSWVFISVSVVVILAGIAICLALLYAKYRREHPRKIKLKIQKIVHEDLEAKRVANSVEEVLGDEHVEVEEIEDENDLVDDMPIGQSFIDRIYASDSELKYYYSEVKNELLSYEGVSHSVDRKYEVFYHGTRQIAKLSICNKVLKLYVNLDPDKYDKSQYNHKDMSKFECHARTPLRIDVNTTESLRHAKVFIRILRKKEKLNAASNFVRIDYEKFYTLKENIFPKLFKKMFTPNKKKK